MNKHASGPWRLSKYVDGRSRIVIDKDGFDVAKVNYPNRDENARLIAAAPCLLEACELVLAHATVEFPEELLAKVRATIRSATVKESLPVANPPAE